MADVGEHAAERGDQGGLGRFIVDAVDMDLDHAFAPRGGRGIDPRRKPDERAVRVTLDGKDGMHQELGAETPLRQLSHDGIEQERHVVVDEFDDGDVLEARTVFRRRRRDTDFRKPRLAFGDESPGRRRNVREFCRLIADEILGGGMGEQLRSEILRRIGGALAQDDAGLRQKRSRHTLFRGGGRKLGGELRVLRHGRTRRRPFVMVRLHAHGMSPESGRRLRRNAAGRKGAGFRTRQRTC